MTGTIEQLHAKLDQVLAILAQLSAGNAHAQQGTGLPTAGAAIGGAGGPQVSGLPATTGASPSNVLGGAGYPPATQEMIVALVTPLVNDPNVKALLQAEMHAMGISALPEAQPHQYPELYARFQGVQARVQAAAAAAPQPAATPASII